MDLGRVRVALKDIEEASRLVELLLVMNPKIEAALARGVHRGLDPLGEDEITEAKRGGLFFEMRKLPHRSGESGRHLGFRPAEGAAGINEEVRNRISRQHGGA